MTAAASLRPATEGDWPVAWDLQRAAFGDLVRASGGDLDGVEAECREAWAPAQTRMVEVAGRVVGWLRVEHHDDHDWLDLIVVHPDDQGRGLGSLLMRRLMDDADTRGVPLWLSVYRINEARRLYARLGFAEVERDPTRVFMVHPAERAEDPPPRGPGPVR